MCCLAASPTNCSSQIHNASRIYENMEHTTFCHVVSVCPSVCHICVFCQNKYRKIFSKFFHHWVDTLFQFFIPNIIAIFQWRPPNSGVKCRWDTRKLLFSTNILLRCVWSTVRPSGVINRVPPDRGKLVTHISGVCVRHSSKARITILLWPQPPHL